MSVPRRYAIMLSTVFVSALIFLLVSLKPSSPNPADMEGIRFDHDNTAPTWDIGPLPEVLMFVEGTANYQLNTSGATAQWSALVSHNGIIHLGAENQPFMISMFHQLRCLDIIRRAYSSHNDEASVAISHHCLNYLRQMVLCRRNLRLERVVDPDHLPSVQPWGRLTCRDWRIVYREAERNAAEHQARGWAPPEVDN